MGSYLDQVAKRRYDRVIGTSGTILSLGALASSSEDGVPLEELRNRRVRAKALHRLRKRLTSLTLEERLRDAGPRSAARRSRRSPARCCSTRSSGGSAPTNSRSATSRCAKGSSSTTSTATARASARSSATPTSGAAASIELGERCGYWPEHAQQVAKLALAIFDQTRSVHGLGDRERDWLEYGALLHDIGVHISYERHHRHSYYLIKNGDLRGFDPAGDRDHRADRPLSPPGHAEEVARGLSRSRQVEPPRRRKRCSAHGQARRRTRSQPRAGAAGARTSIRAGPTIWRGSGRRGTPSWNCGPRTGTSRRSKAFSARPVHFEIAVTGDTGRRRGCRPT